MRTGLLQPRMLALALSLCLLGVWSCDRTESLSDLDARRELARSLPKGFTLPETLRALNAQRAEGDIHGSNDIALEFSASSDDIAMIKVAVLTYFENEHHRDQGFVIDDSDDPKRLADYPGDPAYKPAWWTPQSLPDADVLWVRERGVSWLYIFSKQRGFLFYHLTSW